MNKGRGASKILPVPIFPADKARTRAADSGKKQWGRLGIPPAMVAAMWTDYLRLRSVEKVGKLWGRTRQAVHDIFKTRGLQLYQKKRHDVVLYRGRKFTIGRGVGRYFRATDGERELLHQLMWRDARGEIPDGHEVMFKDGDRQNCTLENLDCVTKAECRRRRRHENAATLKRKAALVDGIDRFIWKHARRYAGSFHVSAEDLAAAGRAQARRAAEKFDQAMGASFLGYAHRHVKGRMLQEAKRLQHAVESPANKWGVVSMASMDAPVGSDEDSCTLGDLMGIEESATEEIEEGDRAELLGAALSELTKRQRYVLEQHFLRGRTMRDLAAELGVTHQAIQQIEQKALRRLRLFSGLERKLAA